MRNVDFIIKQDDSGLAKLFQNIRGGDVSYPARIGASSRDLIAALLVTDEAERLGCKHLPPVVPGALSG